MATQGTSVMVETLASLMYNAGLSSAHEGLVEDAAELFAGAAELCPNRPSFAIAACKANFALGRFESALIHLDAADRVRGATEATGRMRRTVRRTKAIAADSRQWPEYASDPFRQPYYRGSWIVSFCDWLESGVHELCQGLRESVAQDVIENET